MPQGVRTNGNGASLPAEIRRSHPWSRVAALGGLSFEMGTHDNTLTCPYMLLSFTCSVLLEAAGEAVDAHCFSISPNLSPSLTRGTIVKARDKLYHPECFMCDDCGLNLKQRGYFFIEEQLYCETHAKERVKPPEGYDVVAVYPNAKVELV